MPQPIDFTGFSRCLYINFLSTHGKIQVTTQTSHTRGEENLWQIIIISFHLKILFLTAGICFEMMFLPFSAFVTAF